MSIFDSLKKTINNFFDSDDKGNLFEKVFALFKVNNPSNLLNKYSKGTAADSLENMRINLTKALKIKKNLAKRILLLVNKDISFPAFQIALKYKIKNICILNFLDKNSEGFVKKSHIKIIDKTETEPCIFIANTEKTYEKINNIDYTVHILSKETMTIGRYFFVTNLAQEKDSILIEKSLELGEKLFAFSSTNCIFDCGFNGLNNLVRYFLQKAKIKPQEEKKEGTKENAENIEQLIRAVFKRGRVDLYFVKQLCLEFNKIKDSVLGGSLLKLGLGDIKKEDIEQITKLIAKVYAICTSATEKELNNHELMRQNSRLLRIAKGSGVDIKFIEQIMDLLRMINSQFGQIKMLFPSFDHLVNMLKGMNQNDIMKFMKQMGLNEKMLQNFKSKLKP